MTRKSWQALQPGDLIDVVAPGSAIDLETVKQSLEVLSSWGFVPRFESSQIQPHPFCSNSHENRFQYLKKALFSKDSKAIWCLRGGYGSIHLIPALEKLKTIPQKPKLVIGYSDISSLHLFLNQKWKWMSLHAPLIEGLRSGRTELQHLQELKYVLLGNEKEVVQDLIPMNSKAQKLRWKKSQLVGGNLCTLQSHLGTGLHPRWKKKVIAFEDIGERGYRIDRMLEHFRQARVFDGCEAVVFGEFVGSQEKDGRDLSEVALEEFAQKAPCPVFRGLEMGHGTRNRPWFFGSSLEIVGGSQAQIVVQTGVQNP
ncbi:MAG: LD-carboxypeptidase [Proteobacteria bacterium]|jgi:muramoyltetrapeptide carboxypeptidase|nr:LD-carboxypeptidase [Pseudomonadota bacterium]